MTIRIGHCIHGLGLGGAQEVIKTIVAGTIEDGFEHVVYSCEDGMFRQLLERAGATVRIVPRHIPKLDPFWVSRLAHAMRDDAADVVHTHLFGDSLHGVMAARRIGRPSLMTLHLPFRNVRGFQRRGYVWLLHRATRVVACSEEARRTFTEAVSGDVEITTIPNGVDDAPPDIGRSEARRRLGIDEDALVVATIGRLATEKAVPALLEAFSRVRVSGDAAWLVIVGDGEERAALERETRRLRIENRVRFLGQRRDVREILPAFDVVASSSLGEGLPLSLLESMCAGRAVVWTDVDGMSDIVRTEREALLVPADDTDALAHALDRILHDPDLRARLGAAARTRFEERFTSIRMVRSYREIYTSMHHASEFASRLERKAA